MRVLQVIPNIVSAKAFLWQLMEHMDSIGISVHCACSTVDTFSKEGSGDSSFLHHINFPRGMSIPQHIKSSIELNKLVARLQPDIVHAHFSAAIFTTALARRPNWPISIGTFQGVTIAEERDYKAHILHLAEIWASSRMDNVWVLTDDDYERMRSIKFPRLSVEKQSAPGFGCDIDRFNPAASSHADTAALRAELGLRDTDFVFCYVGRFVQFKGFHTVVRAFLKLAESMDNVRLLLIGLSDHRHPTGLTPAEEAVLEQSPRIIRAGFRNDVQRYLALSDAMVFPSTKEGVAVCIMESLAMGVPVITSDARGCRDVVRDNVDGMVLKSLAVESVAAAMRRLAEDRKLRNSFSVQALAGRERLSRRNYIQEQVGIYQRLCNETLAYAQRV